LFSIVLVITSSHITLFQVPYTSENVVEGKRASKQALQQKLGLKTADLPLVGVITRLTHQKGIHLIKHAIWRTLERGGQVFLFLFYISLRQKCLLGLNRKQSLSRSIL
jgi:glycogen synthase